MKIHIEAPWEVNEYMQTLINNKLSKLQQFNQQLIHAEVYLKKSAPASVKNKVMDVVLRLPGPEITATATEDTFEKAITSCVDRLKVQLVKRKEKIQENH